VAVDEKRFLERCIEDARADITRLEKQEEEAQRLLHEEQLMTAKMDGKLQAAQTRVVAMERQIAEFREDSDGMQDEITQLRKQLMQTGSEEEIEKSALQHKLKLKEDENNGIRRERDVIQDRLQGEIR
jgi:chromosome segregation ATPase